MGRFSCLLRFCGVLLMLFCECGFDFVGFFGILNKGKYFCCDEVEVLNFLEMLFFFFLIIIGLVMFVVVLFFGVGGGMGFLFLEVIC